MNKTKAVKDLKKLLREEFGEEIQNVILFGSQAQKNPPANSDYDILVILKNDFDWKFENKILETCYEIDLKYDIVTDVKLISKNDLNSIKGKQPFIQNALEMGIAV